MYISFDFVLVACNQNYRNILLTIDLCNDGEVKLSNAQSGFRQVEVCVNQTWRTICADGWTANNTRVVCRQLGLSNPQGTLLFYI